MNQKKEYMEKAGKVINHTGELVDFTGEQIDFCKEAIDQTFLISDCGFEQFENGVKTGAGSFSSIMSPLLGFYRQYSFIIMYLPTGNENTMTF